MEPLICYECSCDWAVVSQPLPSMPKHCPKCGKSTAEIMGMFEVETGETLQALIFVDLSETDVSSTHQQEEKS